MSQYLDVQAYTRDDVQKLLDSLTLDRNTDQYTMSPLVKQLYDDAEQEKNRLEMQFEKHDIILEDRDDLLVEANDHLIKCQAECKKWKHRLELAEIAQTAAKQSLQDSEAFAKKCRTEHKHAEGIWHQIYDWVYDG